jgi:hypothetical protein
MIVASGLPVKTGFPADKTRLTGSLRAFFAGYRNGDGRRDRFSGD